MIYLFTFVVVTVILALAPRRRPPGEVGWSARLPPISAGWLLPALIVTAVVGLRQHTGTDYARYLDHFAFIRDGVGPLFREPAYTAGAALVAQLGGSAELYLLLLAAVTNLVLFHVIRREGGDYAALFAAGVFGLGLVLIQVNLVRQAVAVALVALAMTRIWRGGLVSYTGLIVLAAGFHYSALLFYPLYWLTRLPVGLFHVHVLCLLALLAFFFPGTLIAALETLEYGLPGPASVVAATIAERGPQINSGIGVLLTFVVGYVGLCLFHQSGRPATLRERAVSNLALLALVLDAALANLFLLQRLSIYLMPFMALLFVLLAERYREPTGRRLLISGVLTAFAARFAWDVVTGTHGAVPWSSLLH